MSKSAPLVTRTLSVDGVRVKGFPFGKGSFAHVDKKLSGALDTFETNLETLSEQVDADLVHVHTWYAHLGGILAKTLYGIPLVHTVHSLEPLRPWKREQLGCGYDMSSWIERTSLSMADAVIAVSEGTKDDILEHFDIDPAKITVIYNGINVDQYHPTDETAALEKYGVDPGKPIVLFVGRITRQKGIVHLVNAIQYINPDAQVVLCAGAPDTKEVLPRWKPAVKRVAAGRFQEPDLDPGDGQQGRGDPAVFACHGLLLPVDLRAFRDHQPRGHGLPHGRRGECRRRHQGGRRRWRHRLPGAARAVARGALRAGQSGCLFARSGGGDQQGPRRPGTRRIDGCSRPATRTRSLQLVEHRAANQLYDSLLRFTPPARHWTDREPD
jgi:hypothetical protein